MEQIFSSKFVESLFYIILKPLLITPLTVVNNSSQQPNSPNAHVPCYIRVALDTLRIIPGRFIGACMDKQHKKIT